MVGSMTIGILVGLATGLWMWGEYLAGLHTTYADFGRFTGFLSVLFPIAGMICALRRARRAHGHISFRAGLPHVLLLCLTATVTMAAMSAIYVNWLNPGWLEVTEQTWLAFVLQGALASLIGGILIGLLTLAAMVLRGNTKVAI